MPTSLPRGQDGQRSTELARRPLVSIGIASMYGMAHRSGAASTGPEQPPGTNSYYFSVAAVGTERRWLDDPCCVETLGEMGIPKSQGRSALALQSITSTLPRPATAASA